jgi:hypothetical protein
MAAVTFEQGGQEGSLAKGKRERTHKTERRQKQKKKK